MEDVSFEKKKNIRSQFCCLSQVTSNTANNWTVRFEPRVECHPSARTTIINLQPEIQEKCTNESLSHSSAPNPSEKQLWDLKMTFQKLYVWNVTMLELVLQRRIGKPYILFMCKAVQEITHVTDVITLIGEFSAFYLFENHASFTFQLFTALCWSIIWGTQEINWSMWFWKKKLKGSEF